jgi:hypothetical protein
LHERQGIRVESHVAGRLRDVVAQFQPQQLEAAHRPAGRHQQLVLRPDAIVFAEYGGDLVPQHAELFFQLPDMVFQQVQMRIAIQFIHCCSPFRQDDCRLTKSRYRRRIAAWPR